MLIQVSLVELPTPSSIRYIWNIGSLLGLCLVTQIRTGLFLAIRYSRDVSVAFYRVNHIIRDSQIGWVCRVIHRNGARFFFIILYLHIGRGLYYGSFNYFHVWIVGCSILLLTIGTAFLGYVLPWGQIRFWGATVITNLVRAIPYIGGDIVTWVWGGFSVDNAALTRFYGLHFLLPFVIIALRAVHLFFLHLTGSRNPLGLNRNLDKIMFNPYFTWKDLVGGLIIMFILFYIRCFTPWILGDPENWVPANPLVTPLHIQPEWYFLFAYAILRRIPNKLGGVVALVLSVVIFYIIPFLTNKFIKRRSFLPLNKTLFWLFVIIAFLLTWIGARPVESPYIIIGQLLAIIYFLWFPLNFYLSCYWIKEF